MEDLKLGLVESHFAEIIWENQPISNKKLVEGGRPLNSQVQHYLDMAAT